MAGVHQHPHRTAQHKNHQFTEFLAENEQDVTA